MRDSTLAQREFKYKDLADALDKAGKRAAVSGVGGNVENTVRQKMLGFEAGQRALSPDELKLANQAIHGTRGQNFLRHVGGFAPAKGFLPAAGGLAAAATETAFTGAPWTTGALAVGAIGAKRAAERMERSRKPYSLAARHPRAA